ncbi:hypothetical protein CIG75_05005 [Tumebacillus algifaecis]|uniref:Uncharacterized protein n=1 Tax=Tumebacillus algifaecis TaxID=1214604 RepID=A0A223CZ06_9BACL|nr:hypothetical protein [Tumebacillus algifaecis]ASS74406.1 hypothetical protein CIG75_05005 [Tumebacillus algifaecis]
MRFRLPVSLLIGIMMGSLSVMMNVPNLVTLTEGIVLTQTVGLKSEALDSFIQRDHNLVLEQYSFYQENRELFDNWSSLQHSEFFYLYQDRITALFEENMQLF